MKKLIFILAILPMLAQAQIVLIDDIAPKNAAFDVIVDINRVGAADTDSSMDMDDDGRIDLRRLELTGYAQNSEVHDSMAAHWSIFIANDTVTVYRAAIHDSLDANWATFISDNNDTVTAYRAAIHDSLDANWATFISDDNDTVTAYRAAIHDSLDANWAAFTAAGSGMPAEDFNDSLESQADFSPNIFNRIDTTTAKIPTATLADSTDGGSARATTSGTADALALIGWGIAVDNDSVIVSATDLDERYFTETEVQGEIGDSLAKYLERVQFKDSLDAAAYLDSTNIANQGIIPEDIDTTENDFVFSGAYRGMSSQAESTFVTIETIEDSLALCGRVAGQVWTGVHDFGGATSLEIPNGANPTTDAEGEIAWDANDDAIEVYSGDEAESGLISFYDDIGATIPLPDGVNDTIILLKVDALKYPHGIEIDQISITVRADGAYTLTLAEYSSAWVWQATTDSIVQASGFYTEDGSPMDNTLDADDWLTAYIPDTDVDQIHIHVMFHIKEGN